MQRRFYSSGLKKNWILDSENNSSIFLEDTYKKTTSEYNENRLKIAMSHASRWEREFLHVGLELLAGHEKIFSPEWIVMSKERLLKIVNHTGKLPNRKLIVISEVD